MSVGYLLNKSAELLGKASDKVSKLVSRFLICVRCKCESLQFEWL